MPQKPSWCRRNHRGTAQTTVAQHKLLWHSTNHHGTAPTTRLGAPGRAGGTELVWGGLGHTGWHRPGPAGDGRVRLEEFSWRGRAVVGNPSAPLCIFIYDDEEANPVPLPPH